MKRMNLGKTLSAAVFIGAAIVATSALAEPPQGAYGPGFGMGGMMGGYGQGYGPGYDMGPGMMGGYGPGYGRGANAAPGVDLHLSAEQRSKIAKIQDEARRKQWDLMGKMQDEQAQMNEQYYSDKRDDATLSKSYRKMSELRHQMFDQSLSAQKQIDAALTKEQREKIRRN